MTVDQVRQFSEWLSATDITLFELTGPGTSLRLRRTVGDAFDVLPATAPQPLAAPPAATTVVRAGTVGIYLQAHPLRTEPLVRAGDEVQEGQAVAILKIGLVLLAVPAPCAGTVTRVVARHESAVGYGDPLIEIA